MAKFTIEVEPVADDSDLRRQLSEALAENERLRASADAMARALHEAHERDTRLTADLNTAAMGRIAARGEADRLCAVAADFGAQRDEARDERDRISAICEKAIAERDEARKALADEIARGQNIGIAGCNLKAGSHVVWMDSAELAALRRERDAAQSQWRALQSEIEGRDADRAELAALRARVAELEATIAAAKVNPLTLFNSPTSGVESYAHEVRPGLWFVGLTVNARGSTGASTEAIKRIACWL